MPFVHGKFVSLGGSDEMVGLLCERQLAEARLDKHAKPQEEILYLQERKLGPTLARPDWIMSLIIRHGRSSAGIGRSLMESGGPVESGPLRHALVPPSPRVRSWAEGYSAFVVATLRARILTLNGNE